MVESTNSFRFLSVACTGGYTARSYKNAHTHTYERRNTPMELRQSNFQRINFAYFGNYCIIKNMYTLIVAAILGSLNIRTNPNPNHHHHDHHHHHHDHHHHHPMPCAHKYFAAYLRNAPTERRVRQTHCTTTTTTMYPNPKNIAQLTKHAYRGNISMLMLHPSEPTKHSLLNICSICMCVCRK